MLKKIIGSISIAMHIQGALFEKAPRQHAPFHYSTETSSFKGEVAVKAYSLFTKNVILFNNRVPSDRFGYALSHTIDISLDYMYKNEALQSLPILGRIVVRNQGRWGAPRTLFVTNEKSLSLDFLFFPTRHRHALNAFIPWIFELWLSFDMSYLLGLPFCRRHILKVGAFPFFLGRGIALGLLTFRNPNELSIDITTLIDQYPFGAVLSGELTAHLSYDLYAALLDSKTSTFEYTHEPVLQRQYGHKTTPERGFGKIDFIAAFRLRGQWQGKYTRISYEPYIVYNHVPEAMNELPRDTQREIATFGCALEGVYNHVEGGLEVACNVGHEQVFGIDRNETFNDNNQGVLTLSNTQVFEVFPTKRIFAPSTPENQKIINQSPQGAQYNGQVIGTTTQGNFLENTLLRFRDPFTVALKGKLCVADISYIFSNTSLRLSGTAGFATGGYVKKSSSQSVLYDFIGINQIYLGKRVPMFFVPLVISRFSNIITVGSGIAWNSKKHKGWNINSNILANWRYSAPFAFDRESNTLSLVRRTRTFMGTEVNCVASSYLLPDLKVYIVGALFFPGSLFKDRAGLPLGPIRLQSINRLNRTGILGNVPVFGADTAYFLYSEIEYRF